LSFYTEQMSSVSFSVKQIIDPSMAEGLEITEGGGYIAIWMYKRTPIVKFVHFFIRTTPTYPLKPECKALPL